MAGPIRDQSANGPQQRVRGQEISPPKNSVGHSGKGSATRSLGDLPNDMLEKISSKLSGVDVVQLRSTDSSLRNGITKPISARLNAAKGSDSDKILYAKKIESLCDNLSAGKGVFTEYTKACKAYCAQGIAQKLFPGRELSALTKSEHREVLLAWRQGKLDLLTFLLTPSDAQQQILKAHQRLVEVCKEDTFHPKYMERDLPRGGGVLQARNRLLSVLSAVPFRETHVPLSAAFLSPNEGYLRMDFRDPKPIRTPFYLPGISEQLVVVDGKNPDVEGGGFQHYQRPPVIWAPDHQIGKELIKNLAVEAQKVTRRKKSDSFDRKLASEPPPEGFRRMVVVPELLPSYAADRSKVSGRSIGKVVGRRAVDLSKRELVFCPFSVAQKMLADGPN